MKAFQLEYNEHSAKFEFRYTHPILGKDIVFTESVPILNKSDLLFDLCKEYIAYACRRHAKLEQEKYWRDM
jgi:hypothetical protein